jgi:hypothetical protein
VRDRARGRGNGWRRPLRAGRPASHLSSCLLSFFLYLYTPVLRVADEIELERYLSFFLSFVTPGLSCSLGHSCGLKDCTLVLWFRWLLVCFSYAPQSSPCAIRLPDSVSYLPPHPQSCILSETCLLTPLDQYSTRRRRNCWRSSGRRIPRRQIPHFARCHHDKEL